MNYITEYMSRLTHTPSSKSLMAASYNKRPNEGNSAYMERVVPEMFEKMHKIIEAMDGLMDNTGKIKFKTEWEKYYEKDLPEKFKETSKKEHHYTSIYPLEQPPEIEKCLCKTPGIWPHLMHGSDPVMNFQSDAILAIYNKITKENSEESENTNNTTLKSMFKRLWEQLFEEEVPEEYK